ncbi:AraC-like DNA-binding protein [Catalinimonas alkaloidigena]|uniref:AraC family transcriptional regulator n=1 Tax=Catalinimonas alkaloidigena TaxID=1075417 RepID=UPI00240603B0|nr:AraC family transcriptional regulator [Catalinimonas alkaloidigena]MDF9798941.1 AraC-like DNA-binding protein [Catalinimonas alkaloidigena]
MKYVEQRLPQEFDKSFTVFREVGEYFPCPWHYHPEYELVLVIKSSGRRMVGDHIGYFEDEDLVFMPPYLPHVWVNDPQFFNGEASDVADAIVIHFNEEFLGADFFKIPEMESFINFLKCTNQGLAIHGKARTEINRIMKKMISMNGIQRLASLLSIFDILSQTTEYKALASHGFVQKISLRSSDQFRKVTEYIMLNFQEEISLSEVAQVANMAVTTFCNFFKENFRMTFVEYVNTLRVGYACKLLSESDFHIVEVAYKCGFNNLANFNRQFKKYKKMTPSEYRKIVNINVEVA